MRTRPKIHNLQFGTIPLSCGSVVSTGWAEDYCDLTYFPQTVEQAKQSSLKKPNIYKENYVEGMTSTMSAHLAPG